MPTDQLIDPFDSPEQDAPQQPAYQSNFVDPYDEPAVPEREYTQSETGYGRPFELPPPQEVTNVRQPGYRPSDIAQAGADVFTGNNRTEFKELPEFGRDMPFEFSTRQAKTAAGTMATFDPLREMAVWKTNYPDLKFSIDKFDNIIVDGTAYGAEPGYLNKPGVSINDIAKLGFQVVAFTPAGKSGALASTTGKRMATVAAGSAATETGLDLLNQWAGGSNLPDMARPGEVSLANVDKGNVGIAAAGGGVFEGLGIQLAKKLRPHYVQSGEVIDDAIRAEFRQAAQQAGQDASQVTDDMIQHYMDASANAVDPRNMAGLADRNEFNIRYTAGQVADDPNQLMMEDRMRSGPSGTARETMGKFQEDQGNDIMAARAREQQRLSPGQPQIEHPLEAGEIYPQGVQAQARAAEAATDAAYADPLLKQSKMLPEAQRGLATRLERVAKTRDFDLSLPETSKAMNEVKAMKEYMQERGNLLEPRKMMHLERIRKRLNTYIGSAEKSDLRQVTQLKREFDNYLDQAFDRALFSGDQDALAALKKARGLHAEYMQRFTRQDTKLKGIGKEKDVAGDAVARIVSANPTAEEAMNYMFGVTKLGGKKGGAKVAERVKEILGEESAEWASIRQAAFMKLTDPGKATTISGEKFLNNLTDAGNQARSLMRVLFTNAEVTRMNKFALAIIRAQPSVMKYGNISRSGHKGAEYLNELWSKIVIGFGFSQGGVTGALAGKGAIEVGNSLGSLRAAMKARAATQPAITPFKRYTLAGPAGATTGLSLEE